MSSHRSDNKRPRRSSRAATSSYDWSDWIFDPTYQRYYHKRTNANGESIFEWEPQAATANADAVSQETPRSDLGPATLAPYASSSTSSDYGSEYVYGSTQPLDSLTDTLAGTSLDSQRQTVTRSTSYGNTASAEYPLAPVAQAGDNAPQPIPIRSSLPSADSYGYQQYSMSAPPGGNMGSVQGGTVAMATGYNTTMNPGGFTNTQDPQGLVSYAGGIPPFIATGIATGSGWNAVSSPSAPFSTYRGSTDLPSTTQQGEASGSGAITPTAPNLIKAAAGARKGDEERLDPRFKVHSSKYFKVFKVLWSQPMGETAKSSATDVTAFTLGKNRFGEKVHSSIRRFVVVTEDSGHCLCLAISTYQRQGTNKSGVKREDHAIIYTKDRPPGLLDGEAPLSKDPIEVIPKTPRDTLEVLFVGHIAHSSQRRFISDYDATCAAKRYNSYIAEE